LSQDDEYYGHFLLTFEGDSESIPFQSKTASGWGIGDEGVEEINMSDANAAWCHHQLPLTTSSPHLDCDGKMCKLSSYLRFPVDGSTGEAELLEPKNVPEGIKASLDERADELWEPQTRQNDGRYLDGPNESEKACFDNPGPADSTLYCQRTSDERWLAYRWYRFVDQPELNQVFASLPVEEQAEAKCFMQQRIERLHQLQRKESVPRWFEAPGTLPSGMAELDQGFIVQPPAGLETGYVPVVVYSKLRTKPSACVVQGEFSEEPNPLPLGFFDNASEGGGYGLDPEVCFGTSESGGDYQVPGTIYVSKRNGSGDTIPYKVPRRSEVGDTLALAYDEAVCEGIPPPINCVNDDGWGFSTGFLNRHDCGWVACNPDTRCSQVGDDGQIASDACPQACGSCSPRFPGSCSSNK